MIDKLMSLPSREEMLLREIQAQLQMWKNMERPLKAAEMMSTIHIDKLAEIMAWAEISLRDYVISRKFALQNEAVTIKPVMEIE